MLRSALLRLSESPAARRVVKHAPFAHLVSRRFVAGDTVPEVVDATRRLNEAGMTATLDYLGESVSNRDEAVAAADTYITLLDTIAREKLDANVSLKLTAMGQDIDLEFMHDNVVRVIRRAAEHDIFVRFDMEGSDYTQPTLDFFRRLWQEGLHNIGPVIQSYLYRSEDDIRALNALGARVRLCKGAYKEPASVAWPDKSDVDANYVKLMKLLLDDGTYPGIATHDPAMIDATVAHMKQRGYAADRFEFQMLYGVRRDLQRRLVQQGLRLRIYVPFGEAWYPYLMRRMAERPANLFFVAGNILKEALPGTVRAVSASEASTMTTPASATDFLRITEIFHSIQGESTWAGVPCTFIRLTGCPLRCVWCDTEYSFHGGEKVMLDDILARVDEIGTPVVEVTGGEPLIHRNAFALVQRLLDRGYTVLVETSGAVDVAPLDVRAHKIMDLKCPGSGEVDRNLWSNLEHLTARDELKFVIADRNDYEWAREVVRSRGLDRRVQEGSLRAILFSPVWDAVDFRELAEWILEDHLPVRYQIQLHKIIWGPTTTGV